MEGDADDAIAEDAAARTTGEARLAVSGGRRGEAVEVAGVIGSYERAPMPFSATACICGWYLR
jgi:hypothetical protein